MTQYSTDWSADTLGAQPADWTEDPAGTNSDWLVTADGTSPTGRVLRVTGAPGTIARRVLGWDSPGDFGGATKAVNFVRYASAPVNVEAPLCVRFTGTQMYGLLVRNTGWRASSFSGAGFGTTGNEGPLVASPLDGGTWYVEYFEIDGLDIVAELWEMDAAAADWGRSTGTDSSGTLAAANATGKAGAMFAFHGTSPDRDIAWFSVGTNGDEPLYPPRAPDTPTVTATVSRTQVTVTGSAFSNLDASTHLSTQLNLRRVDDDTLVYSSIILDPVTSHVVNGVLTRRGVNLYAEMRYQDSAGLWSEWGVSNEIDPYTAAWSAGALVNHLDVLIERPSGETTVMQSYRDFGGRYWIKSLSIQRPSVDQPIGSGTLTLFRQVGTDSLAPLMTASAMNQDGEVYAPALDFGREIEIRSAQEPAGVLLSASAGAAIGATSVSVDYVSHPMASGSTVNWTGGCKAVLSADADTGDTSLTVSALQLAIADGELGLCSIEPVDSAWEIVFQGLTDDIDWPRKSGDVTVPFRDYAGVMSETFFRDELVFGSEVGVDAFEIMQDMVDTGMGAGQFTLDDLTTGARYMVTKLIVRDVSVWQALQNLALEWGGKAIRQEWNEAESEFRIAVIEPDREKSVPDYNIGPSTFFEVHQLSTGVKNVRTIVRGQAIDKETGELLTVQIPEEVDIGTDPLVNLYGPRFLAFVEDSNESAIDSLPELTAMVQAAYDDVSTPILPIEVETPYAPWARVDDLVRWLPNAVLFDENFDAANVSLKDEHSAPGVAHTRFGGANHPKGALGAWLRKGAEIAGVNKRPGILSLVLTHSPTGTLNATVDLTGRVDRWRLWVRNGASPLVGDVPDETYGKGEYQPAQTVVSISPVLDGEHFVVVRAYGPGGPYAQATDEITITGVGGEGEVGDPPTLVPSTPSVFPSTVTGGDQDAVAQWFNTTATVDIEVNWWINGFSAVIVGKAPGSTSDTLTTSIGDVVKVRARYTQGVGDEGPWSGFSQEITLEGFL